AISSPEGQREHKKHSLTGGKGPIRRERTYKTILLANHYFGSLSAEQFALKSRKSKDRVNHLDGTYVVLQFTGEKYSVTHYSAEGGRIKLTAYNSEGEALKELG